MLLEAKLNGSFLQRSFKKNGGQYLTAMEAGDYYGVKPNVIYGLMNKGKIKRATKKSPNGNELFRMSDLILLEDLSEAERESIAKSAEEESEKEEAKPVTQFQWGGVGAQSEVVETPPPVVVQETTPPPVKFEPLLIPKPDLQERHTNMPPEIVDGLDVLELGKLFLTEAQTTEMTGLNGDVLLKLYDKDELLFLKLAGKTLVSIESVNSLLKTIPESVSLSAETRLLLWRTAKKTGKSVEEILAEAVRGVHDSH